MQNLQGTFFDFFFCKKTLNYYLNFFVTLHSEKINFMNKTYEFEAEIKKVPDIDGAYVAFPYDLKEELGKGRVKVHAQFDGEHYGGSIVNMGIKNADGSICYIIGILKDIRKKIGKQAGDKVQVKIMVKE